MITKNRTHFLATWLIVASGLALAQEQDWVALEPMPTARYGITAVVWRNQIVVIGGQDENGQALTNVERYDLLTQSWSRFTAELQEPRFSASAIVYRGRIYVIGGSRDNEILRSVEFFNEQSNRWEIINELREARDGPATALINDTLFAIGGFGADGTYLKSVEFYRPTLNEWDMGRWELSLPRASLAALSLEDSIFTVGGIFFGPVGVLERYHASDGELRRTDMPTPRGSLAAAAVKGSLWAIGGARQEGTTGVVELYDPRTDTWRDGPALTEPRELHAAVVYQDRIYVIGGLGLFGRVLANLEVYDAATTVVSEPERAIPTTPALVSYPNPFAAEVMIEIKTSALTAQPVIVQIFDLTGAQVRELSMSPFQQRFATVWDGRDESGRNLPNGLYFLVARMGAERVTHKIIKLGQGAKVK